MTSWEPNFSWITDQLAVGGSFPAERAEQIARDHGIAAVVDLRQEAMDDEALLRSHGVELLHLPTPDMCGVDAQHLAHGVAFASGHLDQGRRVLVHCEFGIGRSATLALCVLVRRGAAPLEALRAMKDRRALVSPSPVQFECWREWLDEHRSRHAVAWQTPSFDEFQLIAYRRTPPVA